MTKTISRSAMLAVSMFALLQATSATAGNYTIDDVKLAISQYTGIQYAMMGNVVFLHGTTDSIPELGNIVQKLMSIEGVSEVRSNIQKN